jgi:large subunit ribosomal protein L1
MAKQGKRYKAAKAMVEHGKLYEPAAAVELVRSFPAAKFDETMVAAVVLGVDPTKSDQMVRGGVVLPKGLGKTQRVIVFAAGEKQAEARDAGADDTGLEDLIEKVAGGWLEFDVAIATPDAMGKVAKVAKVLGPRGLMPNPKTGTVTFDVAKAVAEAKAGKVDFRVDKGGNVHVAFGKKSFPAEDLQANLDAIMDAVARAKPSASKGVYIRQIHVAAAMSPSVDVDPAAYRK